MQSLFSAIFPLITTDYHAVIIRWNRLGETIPTNGHNIGIGLEIREIAFKEPTIE